jgi:hypothetical protein
MKRLVLDVKEVEAHGGSGGSRSIDGSANIVFPNADDE